MHRRDVLKAALGGVASLALAPAAQAALAGAKLKIVDVRLRRVRLVRELGVIMPHEGNNNTTPRRYSVGGMPIVEVTTDQGLVGYGPAVSLASATPAQIDALKPLLVGRDVLNIQPIAYDLWGRPAGAFVEIALWDLVGKAAGLPLYKLWGGGADSVLPYASQISTGDPAERARMASRIKAAGWKGIKLRGHFDTIKEDVAVVEAVRRAVGDDFMVLVDANQAGNGPDGRGGGVAWDLRRAVETAREYDRLGVYWLEEPLPRHDYDGLAELRRRTDLPIAGGEWNHGLHEFRTYLERGCYDVLNPEVMQEGPTVCRQVAALAQAFGKAVAPHAGFRGLGTICAIHMTASWPNASTLEVDYELPAADIFAQWEIFESPPSLDRQGRIATPQAPGLGVSFKSDLIVDL